MLVGGILAATIGLIIFYPILRLRGTYIALMTLAFSLVIFEMIILLRDITGGPSGLWGIPPYSSIDLKVLAINFSYQDRTSYYYLALATMILTVSFLWTFVNSRYGIFLRIIKESDDVAESIGLDTVKYKLLAFTVSTFIAGIIGSFYAYYTQLIAPDMAWLGTMLDIVLATMLGGVGTIYGAIAGSLVVVFLKEYLRVIGDLRLVLYGIILIIITIFFPSGVLKKIISRGQ
jgi:branched-chain amino acid transport system permease protein